MEQLTLDLQPTHAKNYKVSCIKDGEVLFSVQVETHAAARAKQQRIIELFQRNPYHRVVWDYDPRPTGWFGLKPEPPYGSAVYILTVTPVHTNWS